jgi:hypothetical protein
MAVHQISRVVDTPPHAKPEDELALLPRVELEGNLDGGAGIERGPESAREPFASEGRRAL